MTLQEYLTSLRHKTVAVIGIGVSNTPLLRRLLAEGIAVTACDRSSREKLGPLADELEAAGATLQLGEGYLDGLTQDVIFRTPGLRPDVPQLLAAQRQGSTLTSEMEVFFQVCPCHMIAVTGIPQEEFGTAKVHVVSTLDEALELARKLNGGRDLRTTLLPHGANTLPKLV